jgi:hypothetical protein
MKKVLCLLLAALLVCSMVACGKTPATNETTAPIVDVPDETEEQPQETTEATVPQQTEPQTTSNVVQIPGKEIYFTYPEGWIVEEEIYTLALMEDDSALVGICYDYYTPFDGNLEGLIDYYAQPFLRDISSYSKGYLRDSNIEVLTTESSTIAGYDCVKFTAKARNNDEWDCHLYGYTFVIGDTTLMVTGLVSAQSQDDGMIKAIDKLTDEIAGSVKTAN